MRFLQTLGLLVFCLKGGASQGIFTSFEPILPTMIEWDQTNTTYYTGQTIQMNWTSQNFLPTDVARIQYAGAGGTRTLTTGSGALISSETYSVRLSDSGNGVAANVPLTIALSTNTAINLQSTTRISVIQSKIMNIVPLDGIRTLGGGQNAVCDDRNLSVTWRGLGEAQFGAATVSLSKISGSAGTLGTTQTNIPVSGNMSVTIFCPRTSVPSTFSQYAFQISVVEPGGSAYTGTSASFSVMVAPTPSSTPSTTPTSSNTPSPTPSVTSSPSITPSPTPSPSVSNTPTPSLTPSSTSTPSTTPTANPSIDLAAIGRAAAESVDTTTPAIAGALGGIGGILLLFGLAKWYQNKVMTKKRMRKLQMSSKFVREAQMMYGLSQEENSVSEQPSIVMYSVQGLPSRTADSRQLASIKKGFAPKPT